MGTLLCVRMEIGLEGAPHGVLILRTATGKKPSSSWRPVPPITAMWTGPVRNMLGCGVRFCFNWGKMGEAQ